MPITDSEKARRRALFKIHYDVENSHDMNGIMATFSPDGEMLYREFIRRPRKRYDDTALLPADLPEVGEL